MGEQRLLPALLSRRLVGLVFGNDLRLDRKQLGLRRIDCDADPMGIRIAKGFDPREVLEKPHRLLADQWFADMEYHGRSVEPELFTIEPEIVPRKQGQLIGRLTTSGAPTLVAFADLTAC